MTDLFSLAHADALDAADPLRSLRDEFLIPRHDGRDQAYFCGNSLGLQPRGARAHVEEVLSKWAMEAVEGHFTGQAQWMPYHELVREPLARVVGALPSEVVAMNTLTVNLHLMMVSFYRPTRERPAILIEAGAFPSDRHAVASQLHFHGFDAETDLIELEADEANGTISMAAIERAIAERWCSGPACSIAPARPSILGKSPGSPMRRARCAVSTLRTAWATSSSACTTATRISPCGATTST